MADTPSIYPNLERNFTPTTTGSTVYSYSKKLPGDGPIAVLIHGYPQSAYMYVFYLPYFTLLHTAGEGPS